MKTVSTSASLVIGLCLVGFTACNSVNDPGEPIDLSGKWEYGPYPYTDERARAGALYAQFVIVPQDDGETGHGSIRETFPSATGRYRSFDYLEVEQRFPDVKIYLGGPKPGKGVYEARIIEVSPGEYAMTGRFRYDVFDLSLTFHRRH